MPEIKNWDGLENGVMKGYILYALKMIEENNPDQKLTQEQKDALWNGLRWATSDMTVQDAYNYYCSND